MDAPGIPAGGTAMPACGNSGARPGWAYCGMGTDCPANIRRNSDITSTSAIAGSA